jgi:hypothetical protein
LSIVLTCTLFPFKSHAFLVYSSGSADELAKQCAELRKARDLRETNVSDREWQRDNADLQISRDQFRGILKQNQIHFNLSHTIRSLRCANWHPLITETLTRGLSTSSKIFPLCRYTTNECHGIDSRYDAAVICDCVRANTMDAANVAYRPLTDPEAVDNIMNEVVKEHSNIVMGSLFESLEYVTTNAMNLAMNPDFHNLSFSSRGSPDQRISSPMNLCTGNALYHAISSVFQPSSNEEAYCDQNSAKRMLDAYIANATESCSSYEDCPDYHSILQDPRVRDLPDHEKLSIFMTARYSKNLDFTSAIHDESLNLSSGVDVYLRYFEMARSAIDTTDPRRMNRSFSYPHMYATLEQYNPLEFVNSMLERIENGETVDLDVLKSAENNQFNQFRSYLVRNPAFAEIDREAFKNDLDQFALKYINRLYQDHQAITAAKRERGERIIENPFSDPNYAMDLWVNRSIEIMHSTQEQCVDTNEKFKRMCHALSGNGLGLFESEDFARLSPLMNNPERLVERIRPHVDTTRHMPTAVLDQLMCHSNFISLRQGCLRREFSELNSVAEEHCAYDHTWFVDESITERVAHLSAEHSPPIRSRTLRPPVLDNDVVGSTLVQSAQEQRDLFHQTTAAERVSDARSALPQSSPLYRASELERSSVASRSERGTITSNDLVGRDNEAPQTTHSFRAPASLSPSSDELFADRQVTSVPIVPSATPRVTPEQRTGAEDERIARLRAELDRREQELIRKQEELRQNAGSAFSAQSLAETRAELDEVRKMQDEISALERELSRERRLADEQDAKDLAKANQSRLSNFEGQVFGRNTPAGGSITRSTGGDTSPQAAPVSSGGPMASGGGLSPAAPVAARTAGNSGQRPFYLTESGPQQAALIETAQRSDAQPFDTPLDVLVRYIDASGVVYRKTAIDGRLEMIQFEMLDGQILLDESGKPRIAAMSIIDNPSRSLTILDAYPDAQAASRELQRVNSLNLLIDRNLSQ